MIGYYLILGLIALYAGAYVLHAFRRRAWRAGIWSLLLVALPILCIVGILLKP